jgi:PAS domain S-box-containing protein
MNFSIRNLFKDKSFRRYIPIPLILVLFSVIFYLLYINIKNKTIREFNNEQFILAKTAAQGISSLLKNYQAGMSFIVKHDEIIEFSEDGKKTMKDFFETHKSAIQAITRVDSAGVILHTYPNKKSVIGMDISNQAHVKKVIATHRPVISDVFMSVQGYYAIALHVPIFNKEDYVGSLALLIPVDDLGELFLDNIQTSKKGHTWLITENGTEIYCPIEGHQGKSLRETTNNDKNTLKLLEKIKKQNSGTGKSIHQDSITSERNRENMFVVFHRAQHSDTYWAVLISYRGSEVYQALAKFRNRLIIILSLLFIAVTFYFYSLVKVQNIIREESKRRKAEKLLRESNERFNSFMENTPIYAYIKDRSLNHIYKNRKVESLLGQKDLQAVSSKDIFKKETAEMIEQADKQILSGEKSNVELVFSTQIDGKTVWLKDFKFKINISGKKLAVGGAVFDITETKNYEIELEKHKFHLEQLVQQRTKDLEALNNELKLQKEEVESTLQALKEAQARMVQAEKMASLGILTAGVSHEINNPLQYLSGIYYGFSSYFETYGSQDEETTNLLLSGTETSIKRISSIVEGLNHFSRDNSNFNEDCDIHSIIDNCLTVVHSRYKYTIEIEKNYASEPIIVKGNVGKLHQVFINVLINAIQAIENEGKIKIATYLKEQNAVIEITDTGQGISKENLSKITDPFFTTKNPGKGTGLGLTISYSIINDHNGRMEFESELNKGTKTRIVLPLKIVKHGE